MNGWRPIPDDDRPTLDELLDAIRQQQRVARVLALLATAPLDARGVLAFGHDFRPAGTLEKVRIEIREGTSRAEALRALQEAVRLLIDHWDDLLDPLWGGYTEGAAVNGAFDQAAGGDGQ